MRWWSLRRELRRMLTEQRPDLVAAHFAPYAFPALDMIRPYPLVVHFHGPWALESQFEGERQPKVWAKACLERAVYRRGTRFIVHTRAFRDVLHCDYGVPLERISMVPGGVHVGRFATALTQQEARHKLDWPHDRPIVLAVRRLTRRMGLEDLIRAMCEVRKRISQVQLMVAGRGPLAKTLAARVRSLGLENNVRFLGFVPDEDLPLAYRAADLTAVPTVASEGFGLIAAESLAAGTPVLVTPVGGLPEVVGGLSPELVLPETGADSLGEGLLAALTGSLTLPSEQDCQAYARARYDWPVIAARVREAYAEIVE
jgi:glycosyltransferase involved in cell wall biosynthesis